MLKFVELQQITRICENIKQFVEAQCKKRGMLQSLMDKNVAEAINK
jgi:hypothetical protein